MSAPKIIKVHVERAGHPVVVHRLPGTTIIVGRADECDLKLDDPSVSRRHCRLTRGAGGWTVEDLGSANGTRVDDNTAAPVLPVLPGAAITVGEFRLTLSVPAPVRGPSRPARAWPRIAGRLALAATAITIAGIGGWTSARVWDEPLRLPVPALACPAEDPAVTHIDAALARSPDESAEDALATTLEAHARSADLPAACRLQPRVDVALEAALARIDHQRLGRHDAALLALVAGEDGLVAALDRDGGLAVWDRQHRGRPLPPPTGAPMTLVALARSPDGRWLAAGSDDGRVVLHDLHAQDLPPTIHTHGRRPITALQFSDDRHLWTVDSDGALAVWTEGDATPAWTRTATATAWPGIDVLHAVRDGRVIVFGAGRAAVWSADPRRHATPLTTGATLRALAVAPGGADIVAGDVAGKVTRWQLARTLRPEPLTSHGGPIRAVAIHDGVVASVGEDDALRLVELDRRVRRRSGPPLVLLAEVPVPVDRLAFAGGSLFGAGPGGDLVTWDLSQRTRRLPATLHDAHRGPVTILARTTSWTVTGGDDGAVRLWPAAPITPDDTPPFARACAALAWDHPACAE